MFVDSKQAASDGEITYCSANGEALSLTSAFRLLVRKDVLCKALLLLVVAWPDCKHLPVHHKQALSLILAILRYEATRLGGVLRLQTYCHLHSYLACAHIPAQIPARRGQTSGNISSDDLCISQTWRRLLSHYDALRA